MKSHTSIICILFIVIFIGVIYARELPPVSSIELNWPDRFVAYVYGSSFIYTYDHINQREKLEQQWNVTVRSKHENSSIETRWNSGHVALPVKCEQKTIEDWSLMPRDWFSQVNKSLIRVDVVFQWRFRVKASHLTRLFFIPKTVSPYSQVYGQPEVEVSKLKNILVTVTSLTSDPTWPEQWKINFDIPQPFKSNHGYQFFNSLEYTVKKNYKEELLPLYINKLFEVPSYIKECVETEINPPVQQFEDEEEDF